MRKPPSADPRSPWPVWRQRRLPCKAVAYGYAHKRIVAAVEPWRESGERISASSVHSNTAASRPLSDIESHLDHQCLGKTIRIDASKCKGGKGRVEEEKPKNSMVKTNSSFVSRVSPAENLSRRLNEHDRMAYLCSSTLIDRSNGWICRRTPNPRYLLGKFESLSDKVRLRA